MSKNKLFKLIVSILFITNIISCLSNSNNKFNDQDTKYYATLEIDKSLNVKSKEQENIKWKYNLFNDKGKTYLRQIKQGFKTLGFQYTGSDATGQYVYPNYIFIDLYFKPNQKYIIKPKLVGRGLTFKITTKDKNNDLIELPSHNAESSIKYFDYIENNLINKSSVILENDKYLITIKNNPNFNIEDSNLDYKKTHPFIYNLVYKETGVKENGDYTFSVNVYTYNSDIEFSNNNKIKEMKVIYCDYEILVLEDNGENIILNHRLKK